MMPLILWGKVLSHHEWPVYLQGHFLSKLNLLLKIKLSLYYIVIFDIMEYEIRYPTNIKWSLDLRLIP